MGSEILDSSAGTDVVLPGADFEPLAPAAPDFDFDDLEPVAATAATAARAKPAKPAKQPSESAVSGSIPSATPVRSVESSTSSTAAESGTSRLAPDDPTAAKTHIDIDQPTGQESRDNDRPLDRLAAYVRVLRHDPDRRRTALRMLVACVVLVALTAWLVQSRADRARRAVVAGQVAVDVRLLEVRPASRSFDLNGAAAAGGFTARVELHNLGPAPVRLIGLDVTRGPVIELANDVSVATSALDAGGSLDTEMQIRLPCQSDDLRRSGSPSLNARIRTSDGAVHAVPVNLVTINENGGLLQACSTGSETDFTDTTQLNYSSSVRSGGVDVIAIVGGLPAVVHLITPDVGPTVTYVTTPKLPAIARPGLPLRLRIVPQVARCNRPTNYDALSGVGVQVGTEARGDSNLTLLVAQAIARACSKRAG